MRKLLGPLVPAAILGGFIMAFGFKRGWEIEPPPPQYASGPTQTGKTVETPNLTPEQVSWLCHNYGAEAASQKPGSLLACYVPSIDQVVMPAAKYWPSKSELDQIRAHEWGHARGERHNADGTGVDWARSLPPVAWTNPNAPAQPGNPAPVYVGPPPSAQQTLATLLAKP